MRFLFVPTLRFPIASLLIATCLLWLTTPLTAQYFPEQAVHFTDSDGLPAMEIYDILQDDQGFIWMGTEAGLVRFDGYDFKVFTTSDGLPSNDLIQIEKDAQNRIWINSLGPLCFWDDGNIVMVDSSRTNRTALSFDLAEFSDGSFLLSRSWGYQRYHPDEGFLPVGHLADRPWRGRAKGCFAAAGQDSVWVLLRTSFVLLHQQDIIDANQELNGTDLSFRYPCSSDFTEDMYQ